MADRSRDEPSTKTDKAALQAALANKVEGLPSTPGVYLFKDARGTAIYVGKA